MRQKKNIMGPKEWALSSSETHCSLLFDDGPLLLEGRHTLVMEAKKMEGKYPFRLPYLKIPD